MTDKQPEPTSARPPPYSEDAEKGVIGSALQEPETVLEMLVDNKITDNHFYVPAHRLIYLAMGKLFGKGQPIDAMTVCERLELDGDLDRAGGGAYVDQMIDDTPTVAHVEHYIELIKEKYLLRNIVSVIREVEGRVYQCDDPEELRSKAESAFTRLQSDDPKVTLAQGMDNIINDLQRIKDGGDPRPTGPSTGFPGLDKALGGGMSPGLYFITGQPGTGKTSLACNIILNMLNMGRKPGMVTLEMPLEDMLQKLISMITDKNIRHALVGSALPNMEKVAEARSILVDSGRFDIADQSQIQDETQFRSWCRRKVLKDGFDVIVLDYLQLMKLQDKKLQGEAQVSALTGVVKQVTSDLGIPLLVIAEENTDGGIRYSDRANYAGANHWRLLKVGDEEPKAPGYEQEFDVFTKKARFGLPNSRTAMKLYGATGRIEEIPDEEEHDYDQSTASTDLPGTGDESGYTEDGGLELFDD